MKACVIFACVLIGVAVCQASELTDEEKAKVKEYGKACKEETEVDVELIKKAREGDFTDDAKLKAFTFCMSKKIGFQNEAGDLQNDVVKTKVTKAFNEEIADKLIEQCLKKQGTNEETAFEVFKCYYENTPQHLSVI